MLLSVKKTSVPMFGPCDVLAVEISRDNLSDRAEFSFALGTLVQDPAPPVRRVVVNGAIAEVQDAQPAPRFVPSPVSGSFVIEGAHYADWQGDNDFVRSFIENTVEGVQLLPAP
jgi:hypothetical protein